MIYCWSTGIGNWELGKQILETKKKQGPQSFTFPAHSVWANLRNPVKIVLTLLFNLEFEFLSSVDFSSNQIIRHQNE